VIETARRLRAHASELSALTRRQLDRVWLDAAESPGTLREVAARRVEAESRQSTTLDTFEFCLEHKDGKCVRPTTANEIDDVLVSSRDMATRLKFWEASKESGPALKPGLVDLRGLRNQVARHFDYPSYFDLQVAWYEMSTPEMMKMLED